MFRRFRARRGELVVGALTVLLAYIEAGAPKRGEVKHAASYEDWTLVREAIVWLGEPDPAETMKEQTVDDPEAAAIEEMMNAWEIAFGTKTKKLADAVKTARGSPAGSLYEAMVAAVKREPTAALMGYWFKRVDGRIIGAGTSCSAAIITLGASSR